MEVIVRDNNVDHALRTLKKKMQREGMYREMKKEGHMKSLQKKSKRKGRICEKVEKITKKKY